jgi:hypothetical protein
VMNSIPVRWIIWLDTGQWLHRDQRRVVIPHP